MVAPLLVGAIVMATMTLKSDTKPETIYVKSPKGTLYWGGAGLNGNYVESTLIAFRNAGIRNVYVGQSNTATRYFPDRITDVGMFIDALRAGLSVRYEDNDEWTISSGMTTGEQFNLIGYSYGSLLAAQTANFYANTGVVVDNLVLVASPIDGDFLAKLKSSPNIKKVTVLNIKGDDIYAGMTQAELLNPKLLQKLGSDMLANKGQGHFYFGHPVSDLPARLKALANHLVSLGIK
jgi:pimeloyl-ACP methyl ester carboxylesterase